MPKFSKAFSTLLMIATIALLVSAEVIAQDAKKTSGGRPATLVQVDTVKIVPFAQTIPIIGRFVARQAGVDAAFEISYEEGSSSIAIWN